MAYKKQPKIAIPKATAPTQEQTPQAEPAPLRGRAADYSPPAGAGGNPQAQGAALQRQTNGRLQRAGPALLQMQHRYGNQYVQQVVNGAQASAAQAGGSVIQTKSLSLGPVDDQYEREADRVAQQVVGQSRSGSAPQAEGATGGSQVRLSALGSPSAGVNGPVEAGVQAGIERARGGGQSLGGSVRGQMERSFGADFGGVRLHTGGQADQLNQALQARAFTTGQDIFFRRGEYRPGSGAGRQLLAHELTHVVQQGDRRPNIDQNTTSDRVVQRMAVGRRELGQVKQGARGSIQEDPDRLIRTAVGKEGFYVFSEQGAGVKNLMLLGTAEEIGNWLSQNKERGIDNRIDTLPDIYMTIARYDPNVKPIVLSPVHDVVDDLLKTTKKLMVHWVGHRGLGEKFEDQLKIVTKHIPKEHEWVGKLIEGLKDVYDYVDEPVGKIIEGYGEGISEGHDVLKEIIEGVGELKEAFEELDEKEIAKHPIHSAIKKAVDLAGDTTTAANEAVKKSVDPRRRSKDQKASDPPQQAAQEYVVEFSYLQKALAPGSEQVNKAGERQITFGQIKTKVTQVLAKLHTEDVIANTKKAK